MAVAQTTCSKCKATLRIPNGEIGKRIKCPKCSASIRLEEADFESDAEVTTKAKSETSPRAPRRESESITKKPRESTPKFSKSRLRKKEDAGKNNLVVPLVLGGGLVLLLLIVVGGGVAWWAWPQAKPTPVAVNDPHENKPAPDNKQEPPPVNPNPNPNGGLAPEVLNRVKDSTVYVRVTLQDGRSGSGTGFFAMAPGLVLTNAHVVGMLDEGSPAPPVLEIVLNSGEKNEQVFRSKVATVDRVSDLAVLQVEGTDAQLASLPAPLPVMSGTNLRETQQVYVFGFPFGEALGKNITISTSAVSSLRKDKKGNLVQIQVNGGMHPGNSGGPVVDTQGNVIGVAVAVIRGTQINFAIPGDSVHSIVNGRVSACSVGDQTSEGGKISLQVAVNTIDPLKQIAKLTVDWWIGNPGPPRPPSNVPPEPAPGDSPLETLPLNYQIKESLGKAVLVLPSTPPITKVLWVRPVIVNKAGQTFWMQAVSKEVDRPLEPVPVPLRLYQHLGKAPLDLKSRLSLRLESSDGDKHSVMVNIVTRLAEEVITVDPQGKASLRLSVDKFELGVSVDDQAPPRSPRLQRIVQDVGLLALALQVDQQGNITRSTTDLTRVPAASKELLESFAEQIHQSLDTVAVPLPGTRMEPGQSWRATRLVPIETLENFQSGSIDMTYTFLGIRQELGRREAVIAMEGTVRGVRGRSGNLSGQAKGTAIVDLGTSRVKQVDAVVDVALDLFFREQSFHAKGKHEISLTRGTSDRLNNPSPTKPADPNSILGNWIEVHYEFDGQVRVIVPKKESRYVITADKINIGPAHGGTSDSLQYRLRPGPGPKAMEIYADDEFDRNRWYPAIYSLEGDTLKICMNQVTNRLPTSFATFPKSGLRLVILKRASELGKPIEVGGPDIKGQPPPKSPDSFKNDPSLIVKPDESTRKGPMVPPAPEPASPVGEARTLPHEQPVSQLLFTPDGRKFLSCGLDKTIRLWEVETGKELQRIEPPKPLRYAAAITPDGRHFLWTHPDNTLRLWDLDTWTEVRRFEGHVDPGRAIAFSSNAKYAVSGGDDHSVRLWEVATGKQLRRMDGHTQRVNCVAISPDGKQIISGADDQKIKLWDFATGKEIFTFPENLNGIRQVGFTPDGRQAYAQATSARIAFWDLQTKKRRDLEAGSGIFSIAFSPNGRYVMAGNHSMGVYIYEISSGKMIWKVHVQSSREWTVAWSPGGRRALLNRNGESGILVWNLPEDKELALGDPDDRIGPQPREVRRLGAHKSWVGTPVFSPDSKLLVSSSGGEPFLRLWDVQSGKELKRLAAPELVTRSIVFSSDGKRILSGGGMYEPDTDRPIDLQMHLWDVQTGKELQRFPGHPFSISTVGLPPGSRWAVSGSDDYTIRVWDVEAGKTIHLLKGHQGPISGLSFSPDGKRFLAYDPKRVLLWDLESGREIRSFQEHPVSQALFLPDGKQALSACGDGTIRFWDVDTGIEKRRFQAHPGGIGRISIAANGRLAIITGEDKTLRFLDLESGKELHKFRHPKGYANATLSPDGRYVAITVDKDVVLLEVPK